MELGDVQLLPPNWTLADIALTQTWRKLGKTTRLVIGPVCGDEHRLSVTARRSGPR
jgi:hypothetical protein